MQVLIDGDSCPRAVREVVAKACQREGITVTCFANRPIPFPPALNVLIQVVAAVEAAADDALVDLAVSGDLVLTRDIPLAARLVENQVAVLNDRGALYTAENIRERLSVRDFMAGLNASGLKPESTATYGKMEWDKFVRTFDTTFMALVRVSRKASSA
jgi:uncharacterized protein YaiI (UPF0178 family)